MNKTKLFVQLAVLVVVVAGGAFAYYRFSAEPMLPPDPPGFVEIAQAQLPLDSYAKIPEKFPAEMILGTRGDVIDGKVAYFGDLTVMDVFVSSPDKADFLKGEYEEYFKAFGYTFSTTQKNQLVTEVKGVKDAAEMDVNIVSRDTGSLIHLKYQVTFK